MSIVHSPESSTVLKTQIFYFLNRYVQCELNLLVKTDVVAHIKTQNIVVCFLLRYLQ